MKSKTVSLSELKPGQVFGPSTYSRQYISLFREGTTLITARTDHAKKMLNRFDARLQFYTWKDKGHGTQYVITGKVTPGEVKTLTECHKRLEKNQEKYVKDNYDSIDTGYTPGGATVKLPNGQYVEAGDFVSVEFKDGHHNCRVGNLSNVLWNNKFEVAVMPLRWGEIDESRKHAIFVSPKYILKRVVKDDRGLWQDAPTVANEKPKEQVTKEKVKPVMPKFTDEQKKRIAMAINITWQDIGHDVITSTQENEHRDYVTKDEMIEVTTDANHVETYGRDKEAAKWIDELYKADYDGACKFLRKLFKYKRYG